jgi:hypothetical protein
MRILIVIQLLLVGACNVSKDEANNTVSMTVNEEQAANAASDISNGVQNVASDVGNEASNLGDKVQNTDLDVKVDRDVKTENKSR